jgi:hypothetical protein
VRFLASLVVVAGLALSGCVDEDEVREACADHNGIANVNGNNARVYVTCRDGWFEKVR